MKSSIPIAVSTGTFFPLSTLESIQHLKGLGIQDIELTLQQAEFSLTFERELSMSILPELSALVQKGKLCVRSVHAPSIRAERCYNLWARRQLLIHTIEVCRLLGGQLVVVHPFHLFRIHEDVLDYLAGDNALSASALLPGLNEVLDLAQSAGIKLALENIQDWQDEVFFNSPKSVFRFLRDMDHPSLGFTLDLMHAQVAGFLDEFIDSLFVDIVNIHASDLLPPTKRVPIGKGVIDWNCLVPTFQTLPNLRQITVELSNPPSSELTKSIELLSDLP
ncbi:MAG TPA: sugar phosphate isomerase/epimerase family protein [Anaerolineales bacterium]|nr:sugar phosphate isomerase/epimerase family protein [Anaerolineales bacterium]